MGDRIYRRTQIAWPAILPLAPVAAILVPVFLRARFMPGLWIVVGVSGVIVLLFATLTVTVTSDRIVASFGVGLVRKRVLFADVVSFSPVRNPWIYGWGIRYFPGGVIYNASGLSAIEFKLSNGRCVRIGTGEPETLASALQQVTLKGVDVHEPPAGTFVGAQLLIGVVIPVVTLAVAASMIYAGFKPPAVTLSADAITVSNGPYSSTVPYASIRTATMEVALPRIAQRTNGFGGGSTLRGNFILDDWGRGRLFINRDVPPFVVIRTADTFLVVNFKDPDRTRELYSALTAQIDRSHR
jgi:hypothetical protein